MSEQYEVLAVRYGTRQASAAEVFLNYHVYHEPDRPLGMDYFFWVARNPARSVVIDTGFGSAAGAARDRTMLMDTVPALAAAGLTPDDVACSPTRTTTTSAGCRPSPEPAPRSS